MVYTYLFVCFLLVSPIRMKAPRGEEAHVIFVSLSHLWNQSVLHPLSGAFFPHPSLLPSSLVKMKATSRFLLFLPLCHTALPLLSPGLPVRLCQTKLSVTWSKTSAPWNTPTHCVLRPLSVPRPLAMSGTLVPFPCRPLPAQGNPTLPRSLHGCPGFLYLLCLLGPSICPKTFHLHGLNLGSELFESRIVSECPFDFRSRPRAWLKASLT
jgi:hypothetical protein